jgi:hypothetical protein
MSGEGPPGRFYAVAIAAGFAFASMAVAVPLYVVAVGASAGVAGDILALGTLSVAVGALVAGRLGGRAAGGARLLGLGVAVTAAGSLVLAATDGVALLAAGVSVVGTGIGIFWVSSQLILSARAGRPDGARAFLLHYAVYTLGAVLGSSATGALASGARALGFGTVSGIHAGSALAVFAAALACAAWRSRSSCSAAAAPSSGAPSAQARRLDVQVPDLLLVAALGLLLPLAPVVLARNFGLAPFSVGLVMGGVAVSKIAGTFAARLVSRASGPRRTILILLLSGAAFSVLLCSALTLSLFVTTLFATALTATGAWPLVVDAAQARVAPAARRGLTVRWNAREYVLIAASTAASGWLLTTLGSAVPLFALSAFLFAGAAASAAVVLRRPVWLPSY